MSRRAPPIVLPADADLDRRQLGFAWFAVALDPRVTPLLEPGARSTHPVVLAALLLFDGVVTGVRAVPRTKRAARRRVSARRLDRGGSGTSIFAVRESLDPPETWRSSPCTRFNRDLALSHDG